MENKGESTSPEVRAKARQLSRLVWSIALVMVGVLIGLLAARSRNAADALRARQSPAGKAYGYAMPLVRLDRPTLRQALTALNALSHADMQIDWDDLAREGYTCDSPLHLYLDLRNVTLDQILPMVMSASAEINEGRGANWLVHHDQFVVTTSDGVLRREKPDLRIYDVGDVLAAQHVSRQKFPDDEGFDAPVQPRLNDADYLVNLIKNDVASDTWADSGGTGGAIAIRDSRLAVVQWPENQLNVSKLLDHLRKDARTLETLPAPRDLGKYINADLSRNIGDLSFRGTPLKTAVQILRDKSGANIFVNWADLSHLGVSAADRIDLSINRATLQQSLTALVEKLNAHAAKPDACRWDVRDRVVVIASRRNLETGYVYPVVYSVDAILNTRQKAGGISRERALTELVGQIRGRVEPGKWDGPAPPNCDGYAATPTIRIWADKLIIEQSIGHHAELARLFERMGRQP